MRKRTLLLLLLLLAAATVGGVASRGAGTTRRAPRTSVEVREKDFRIHLSRSRLPAGEVRFVVRNTGPDDHELIVVKAPGGALPMRGDGFTVDEDALESRTVATLEPAGPGVVRVLRVRLAPGSYEVFCNMAGHFMGGMRAFFTVV
jgi:uncharacterized cupredoxin-like copper-binding protein